MRGGFLEIAAVLTLAGLVATSAAAQSLPPAPVIPEAAFEPPAAAKAPVLRTPADAYAWVKANLKTLKDWEVMGYNQDSISLASYGKVAEIFDILVRFEFLTPQTERDGSVTWSAVFRYEVKCRDEQSRILETIQYAENDLKQLIGQSADTGDWVAWDPKMSADDIAKRLCLRGHAPPRRVEGPRTMVETDIRAWMTRTVEPGADAYAFYDESGVNFLHGTVTLTAARTYLVALRSEYFEPDGDKARSNLLRLELDCAGRRKRELGRAGYPEHNLKGRATTKEEAKPEWTPSENGVSSMQMDRFCSMARAAAGG